MAAAIGKRASRARSRTRHLGMALSLNSDIPDGAGHPGPGTPMSQTHISGELTPASQLALTFDQLASLGSPCTVIREVQGNVDGDDDGEDSGPDTAMPEQDGFGRLSIEESRRRRVAALAHVVTNASCSPDTPSITSPPTPRHASIAPDSPPMIASPSMVMFLRASSSELAANGLNNQQYQEQGYLAAPIAVAAQTGGGPLDFGRSASDPSARRRRPSRRRDPYDKARSGPDAGRLDRVRSNENLGSSIEGHVVPRPAQPIGRCQSFSSYKPTTAVETAWGLGPKAAGDTGLAGAPPDALQHRRRSLSISRNNSTGSMDAMKVCEDTAGSVRRLFSSTEDIASSSPRHFTPSQPYPLRRERRRRNSVCSTPLGLASPSPSPSPICVRSTRPRCMSWASSNETSTGWGAEDVTPMDADSVLGSMDKAELFGDGEGAAAAAKMQLEGGDAWSAAGALEGISAFADKLDGEDDVFLSAPPSPLPSPSLLEDAEQRHPLCPIGNTGRRRRSPRQAAKKQHRLHSLQQQHQGQQGSAVPLRQQHQARPVGGGGIKGPRTKRASSHSAVPSRPRPNLDGLAAKPKVDFSNIPRLQRGQSWADVSSVVPTTAQRTPSVGAELPHDLPPPPVSNPQVLASLMHGQDIRGDRRKKCALPTTMLPHPYHSEIRSISTHTLVDLIDGRYSNDFDRFVVVDCRYPYEYAAGHIPGAINLWNMNQVASAFLANPIVQLTNGERIAIVFHCEFSARRGPEKCQYLRNLDQTITLSDPGLIFPEMYVLEGGYAAFYKEYAVRCEPSCYVQEQDAGHVDEQAQFSRILRTSREQARQWQENTMVLGMSERVQRLGLQDALQTVAEEAAKAAAAQLAGPPCTPG